MENMVLKVEGMSCSHCEKAIKNALTSLDGVREVEVDLVTKLVSVDFDTEKVSLAQIKNEIEDQGYDVAE